MRILMMFSVWGLAAGLTACASYHPKPLKPDASLAALNARRLDDANLINQLRAHYPQRSWPPVHWDLDSLTLAAAEIHPDMAEAQTELHIAEVALDAAGVHPNPQLNLTGQHTTNPTGQGSRTLGFGFDILLETAGKRNARLSLAAQQVAVARAHLDDVRWQLRAHIRDALLALAEARDAQVLTQAQVIVATHRAQALAKRVDLGLAVRSEQLAAEAQMLDLQQSLSTAKQNDTNAQIQLASALGVTPQAVSNIPLILPTTKIMTTSDSMGLIAKALRERSDIQAALAEYAVSEAKLQLEIAKQYPDLTLSPSYLWDAKSVMWSLGVGLVLPIFNHNQTGIADADAGRQLARTRFEALQLKLRNAIEQAVMNEKATQHAQSQAEDSARVARRQLQVADAAFAAGSTDRVQLLDVQQAQAVVRQSELTARITHARAIAALEDALQLPLSTFQDTSTP